MVFLQIEGFDYEVSDSGIVRSLPRIVMRSNGKQHTVVPKELRPRWGGRHVVVGLRRDKKEHRRYVHHLVLETFVCPRPEGMFGLHLDDDPTNNDLSNLRWGTRSDNAHDAVRNGRHQGANKTHCVRGHLLSEPNICPWWEIRTCWACNKAKQVARYHGRGDDEAYVQQLADERYAAIMAA